jgi:hypothetical protein
MGSTGLAAQLAPPREPVALSNNAGCVAFLVALGAWFGTFFPVLIVDSIIDAAWGGLLALVPIPTIVAIIAFRSANQSAQKRYLTKSIEYQNEMAAYRIGRAAWERSFVCHRCGDIFELAIS